MFFGVDDFTNTYSPQGTTFSARKKYQLYVDREKSNTMQKMGDPIHMNIDQFYLRKCSM